MLNRRIAVLAGFSAAMTVAYAFVATPKCEGLSNGLECAGKPVPERYLGSEDVHRQARERPILRDSINI